MAIGFPCPPSVAAPVSWVAAPASACRRRQASSGVSPGRINLVPCGTGSLAPPRAALVCGMVGVVGDAEATARSAGATGARTGPGATGFVGVEMTPIRDPLTGFCSRDCLAGLRPSSRWSHRRIVSRPISMPINRRPPTSDSADSPAWASRSNSSRCGSNWAVAWLRGCRTWATAWDSVVGRAVASGEWMGSDMGADEAQYMWWSGRARGAPRAQSKRQRLDVGVIPHCFLLVLVDRLIWFSGFLGGFEFGWIGWLKFSVGSWFEWFVFGELVESLSSGFQVGPCSLNSGWVYGGGEC